jgi:hypothetical protein
MYPTIGEALRCYVSLFLVPTVTSAIARGLLPLRAHSTELPYAGQYPMKSSWTELNKSPPGGDVRGCSS